jgi:hypothetical protein
MAIAKDGITYGPVKRESNVPSRLKALLAKSQANISPRIVESTADIPQTIIEFLNGISK